MFYQRRYLIPFRSALLPQIFTEVLVVGGGVAGARAALAAAEHSDVIMISKGSATESSTAWAQGGIAAVLDAQDSVDEHVADTLVAGAGLCDEPIVRTVIEGGATRVRELQTWGMRLDKKADGELAYGREGGHGKHRIVHSDGDATGAELIRALHEQVNGHDRIRQFDQCFAMDLITLDTATASGGASTDSNAAQGGRCVGVITHHAKYGLQMIWAGAVILASGGCGKVYRETTNPSVATGDGHAMAFRAGAALADMAFMQFHPTTLYIAGASRSLITEAVRGEGAYLVDRNGHRFMFDYDERGELAPRDIVARANLSQMAKTAHSCVYLDCRHIGAERFNARFPGITKMLAKFDIDPMTDTIPTHPSAHYMIGGLRTDVHGRTNIRGLYACGEAACSGLHGANRLASNSLLEGLVLGEIAGRVCQETKSDGPVGPIKVISDIPLSAKSELDLADVRSSLRSVMWRHVGIERDGMHLHEVSEMFDFWARYTMDKIFDERLGWEVQNLLTVGAMITRSALWRAESRGTHYRTDFPESSDEFRVHDIWQRGHDEPEMHQVLHENTGGDQSGVAEEVKAS